MSRQDKTTTDKFTKILRELVKKQENKLCADCKRNDPRWASWNIGVFLCIRCSGIHRGMGTHISKVKSVDLDVWTPEQMESIQKWGNYRANLYWEAHLKAGHVPPDHKMESFIRSKYESRRWALDGPVPIDPSILEGSSVPLPASTQLPAAPSVSHTTHSPSSSPSTRRAAPPVLQSPITTRQPQPHQLLSTSHVNQPSRSARASAAIKQAQAQATAPPQPKAPENDLFTLDFHAPTPSHTTDLSVSQQPKKDVKQDILSLFSSQAAAVPTVSAPAFNQLPTYQNSDWAAQQPTQPTSMMGSNGIGMWGASSGWNGAAVLPAQGNVWGNPATPAAPPVQQPNLFSNNHDVWGAQTGNSASGAGHDLFSTAHASAASVQKKDDVFEDIWGGFK